MNMGSHHGHIPCAPTRSFHISSSLQRIIGEGYARRHRIIVLKNDHCEIEIAMEEPSVLVMDELRKALPTGKKVVMQIATSDEIEDSFARVYDPFSANCYR